MVDLKRLDNEIQFYNIHPADILQYKNIIEPSSGYPIYMMFEVFHVKRKTVADI